MPAHITFTQHATAACCFREDQQGREFSELHPYLKASRAALRGQKIKGILRGLPSVVSNFGMLSGIFTNDPGSWANAFFSGEPRISEIRKDWGGSNLYVQIMNITEHYIPIYDENGVHTTDPKTGKLQYRLGSKTVEANIYSGYIWNDDNRRYEGVNKVDSRMEVWEYDKHGNRIKENASLPGMKKKTL